MLSPPPPALTDNGTGAHENKSLTFACEFGKQHTLKDRVVTARTLISLPGLSFPNNQPTLLPKLIFLPVLVTRLPVSCHDPVDFVQ